ncbi:MAG: S24/S26 family peptidase [Candidatus Acidiferrales bacterium]
MIPAIWPGEILLIQRKDIHEISQGEVVVYQRGDRLYAHRVICCPDRTGAGERSSPRLITRGDAIAAQDPPVSESEFLGYAAAILRNGAWQEIPARPGFGQRVLAALARHSSFVARIALHLRAVFNPSASSSNSDTGKKSEVVWGL